MFLAAPAGCLRGRTAGADAGRRRRRGGAACTAKGGPSFRPRRQGPRLEHAGLAQPPVHGARPQGRGSRGAGTRRRDRRRARMRDGAKRGRWRTQAALRRWAPGARRPAGSGPRHAAAGSRHGLFARPGGPAAHVRARGGMRSHGACAAAAPAHREPAGQIAAESPGPQPARRRVFRRPLQHTAGGEPRQDPVGQDPGEPPGFARPGTAARYAEPPRCPYGRRPYGPLPAGSGADCEGVGYRAWQGACQPPRTGRSFYPQRAKPSGAGVSRRLQGIAPRGGFQGFKRPDGRRNFRLILRNKSGGNCLKSVHSYEPPGRSTE